VNEWIIRESFRGVESLALVLEELPGEIVAVHYPKNSPIQIQVYSQVQIFPSIVLGRREIRFWNLVSLQKNALRYARIF